MSQLPFDYSIRRSQRASKVRITVSLGKVEVVAPEQVPERLIRQFVAAKQHWVMQVLAKLASRHNQHCEQAAFYRPDVEMTYQGSPYPITVKTTTAKRMKIEFSAGFTVHKPASAGQEAIKTALAAWLKKQTKQQVVELVERHGGKHGLVPRSITIKSQKSRWGSCGIRNDIHINWLLMAAPPSVLEYVVVHELCHLRVRNHSADFWALVELHLPDYKNQRRWLKQHGANLLRSWL